MFRSGMFVLSFFCLNCLHAENLLENSGFENGLESWENSGRVLVTSNSTPGAAEGSLYIFGNSEQFSVWQDIDLVASGISEGSIDQGTVSLTFGGMQAGWSGQGDYGQISVYFYDESLSVLSSYSLAETSVSSWVEVSGVQSIDVGTRFIRYEFVGKRLAGIDNDAYLDGAFAMVTPLEYHYIDQVMIKDINGNNYSELVALRKNRGNNKPQVLVKDSSTKKTLKTIGFFDSAFTPKGLTTVSDMNGNNVDEIAVLATRNTNGAIQVQIKDAGTRKVLKTMGVLNRNYNPLSVSAVSDIDGNGTDEIAVLAKHKINGEVVTQIKDAKTGAVIHRFSYPR